ncbi:MAG: hydantoinase/oxoprolinase N-terminal domain-containing protein [Candidatus Puniceispirillaceae bacterium]|jgi:N-methylhydantoinase A/oxoprolinase/acetone carboxylase beta subunit
MTLVIGLDTGGTYTDAALLDATGGHVLATGKALTTRDDLSIGLGEAIATVLQSYDGPASDIGMVSLSTTLATNAVVEGVGGRVGLFMIGFDDKALERADLARAIGQDPVQFVAGGHRADGGVQEPFDSATLTHAAASMAADVSAFAVAGHFATRNPAHETAARDILRETTGLPVTCSHELSSALGGPRRALTAVLNARLINLLERLVTATEIIMKQQGLTCPLMVVKGDGSLLESGFARTRPVETVLSGPAASLSGAAFLAGTDSALVADIGGTTTDIAFLQNGAPRLKSEGAYVGGWQTMVEAAEIRTCGLGGDSEVTPVSRGRISGLRLGPRRAVPLALLARTHPEIKQQMQAQLDLPVPSPTDGRFVFPIMPDGVPGWLTRSEARLAERAIDAGPTAIADLAATQLALGAADRLISRGLLGLAAFTPTDATHVTGDFNAFDDDAARLGAELMARQRNGLGESTAANADDLARMTLVELHKQSAIALMDAALAHQGAGENTVSQNPLLMNSFINKSADQPLVNISMRLGTKLAALGASAATHYPHIADLLDVALTVPSHAEVAGAVGAAVGSVRQRVMITVTQPADGKFRVHLPQGPADFGVMEEALENARMAAKQLATTRAKSAGATAIDIKMTENIKLVPLDSNKDLFIEATIQAAANGTPA